MRFIAVISLLASLLSGFSAAALVLPMVEVEAAVEIQHDHGVHVEWSLGDRDDHESHGHGNEHCGVSCGAVSALPIQSSTTFSFASEARISGPILTLDTQHHSPLLRPPR